VNQRDDVASIGSARTLDQTSMEDRGREGNPSLDSWRATLTVNWETRSGAEPQDLRSY
jgi:hypothetical protein